MSRNDPVLRNAVVVIAVLAVFATLKAGVDIFAPITLGLVFGVMLAPITQLLEKFGLPAGLSAALVLVFGLAAIATLAFLLEPVVSRVIEQLPRIKWELRSMLDYLRDLARGLDDVNREVEKALGGSAAGDAKSDGPAIPNATDALLLAPLVLAQVLIFSGTLFFFLLTRKGIYRWLARWIGSSADTLVILGRFNAAERLVSRYFLTILIINTGLGALLGASLTVIGLPFPLLWGAVAALLNFVLYLGPMTVAAGLLLAGLISFEGVMALAPVATYLTINMMESQFVTPTLLSKHMSVNPLLIFVSLVVWIWLWGPLGGIIAIPVLVIVMVMLDLFEPEPSEDPVETPEQAGLSPAA